MTGVLDVSSGDQEVGFSTKAAHAQWEENNTFLHWLNYAKLKLLALESRKFQVSIYDIKNTKLVAQAVTHML